MRGRQRHSVLPAWQDAILNPAARETHQATHLMLTKKQINNGEYHLALEMLSIRKDAILNLPACEPPVATCLNPLKNLPLSSRRLHEKISCMNKSQFLPRGVASNSSGGFFKKSQPKNKLWLWSLWFMTVGTLFQILVLAPFALSMDPKEVISCRPSSVRVGKREMHYWCALF